MPSGAGASGMIGHIVNDFLAEIVGPEGFGDEVVEAFVDQIRLHMVVHCGGKGDNRNIRAHPPDP